MDQHTAQVATWLRLFIEPGQVTELRALDVVKKFANGEESYPKVYSGFFDYDHIDDMAKYAMILSPNAVGVYFVPNPIKTPILARCKNRIRPAKEKMLASDKDIDHYKWLLIDADPIRPEGISSTDEEKQRSWEVIVQVKEYLWALDWSTPVLADSGNGYHLLYPINQPCTPDGVSKCQSFIQHIADRFDTPDILIDRKVFNSGRIVKLYGTTSSKGDSTEDRPHRQSKVIENGTACQQSGIE